MRNRETCSTAEVLRAKILLDKLTGRARIGWVDPDKIEVELQKLGWDVQELWNHCQEQDEKQGE